jgi:hypothetical protein
MNEGFLLKLIFRKAMGDTNQAHHEVKGRWSEKLILKTIWDRMNFENPIAPFTDYFNSVDPN